METESPVSNVGRVKFKFEWRLGTKAEAKGTTVEAGAGATIAGKSTVAVSTVEATDVVEVGVAEARVSKVGSEPITSRL